MKRAAVFALLVAGCATVAPRGRCPPPTEAPSSDEFEVQVVADARLCVTRVERRIGKIAVDHDGAVHGEHPPTEPPPPWFRTFDARVVGERWVDRILPLPRGGWMTTHVETRPLRLYFEQWARDGSVSTGFLPGAGGDVAVNETGSWVADWGREYDDRARDGMPHGFIQLFDPAATGRGWKRGYSGTVGALAISKSGNVAFVNERQYSAWVVYIGRDGHERWRRRLGDVRADTVSLAFSDSERVVAGLPAKRADLHPRRRVGPVARRRWPLGGVVAEFSPKGVVLWSRGTAGVPDVVAGPADHIWAVHTSDGCCGRRRRHRGGVTFTELSRGRAVWRGSVAPMRSGLDRGLAKLAGGADGTLVATAVFGEAPHPHGGPDPPSSVFLVYIPPR